ncbi:MAG: hypothetical protein J1E38_03230 [Paramuribaculum sp.]|nr:hypothetical protein [Paramuribaculum sp.]
MAVKPFIRYRCLHKAILIIIFSIVFLAVRAEGSYDSLMYVFNRINSQNAPRERVYLHLDNTSYYKGDKIWFKGYVVTDPLFEKSNLSETLYVELLNPGGKVVDRRTLRIIDGTCHGELNIGQLPFYSGFYEVRAYTRYMLDSDGGYSRVIPVFDSPTQEGDYSSPSMLAYGKGPYKYQRPPMEKIKYINLKLYPEGGHLVNGLKNRVACETTDKSGRPLSLSGAIINKITKDTVTTFKTSHNGRTAFDITPSEQEYIAQVTYEGRTFTFDLPRPEREGIVMTIDNISQPDSIAISMCKTEEFPLRNIGISITCRGHLYGRYIVDFTQSDTVDFKIDSHVLPTGVIDITLFDHKGKELANRLIFNNHRELIDIKLCSEHTKLTPFQPVELVFSMNKPDGSPSTVPFSLSVADGTNHVKYDSNVFTELLLASEIKGYVEKPNYYFENDSLERRQELDCLLMIQGWKRYTWDELLQNNDNSKNLIPEKNIEIRGTVVSFVRSIPKPNVTVSAILMHKPENDIDSMANLYNLMETDSLGRFSLSADIDGKWTLVLSASENGKKKDHRILLDRSILPAPRMYKTGEMRIDYDEIKDSKRITEITIPEENADDSLLFDKKSSILLNEVVVTSKRSNKERDIYKNRAGSVSYYDINEERNKIQDNNIVIGQNFNELLLNMDQNFSRTVSGTVEKILYKGKEPLIVVDYEPNYGSLMDSLKHTYLYLESIKSIYINENPSTILKYADPAKYTMFNIDHYGCAVFIETDPDRPMPPGKGSRRTLIEGYSRIEDFYSPDYSYEPEVDDYRRTLYWNPEVTPDNNGIAKVRFFNNGTCENFIISAETISSDGTIGLYRR